MTEPYWKPMESAPKDDTKFIGLMEGGLVFLCHWQAYHTYMTKEEEEEFGHQGFHPTRMRHGWSYEESSSHMPCNPIGWIPMPAALTEGTDHD